MVAKMHQKCPGTIDKMLIYKHLFGTSAEILLQP